MIKLLSSIGKNLLELLSKHHNSILLFFIVSVIFLLNGSTAYAVMDGRGNSMIPGNVGIGTTLAPNSGVSLFVRTGNVGIGSSAPGQVLDVMGTVRATAFVGDASGLTGLTGTGWTTLGNDVYKTSNGNVGIGTTLVTSSALTVMNGNVGIGTWKPAGALEIKQNNNSPGILLGVADIYNKWRIDAIPDASNADLIFSTFTPAAVSSEKIRFNENGQVCIGYSSSCSNNSHSLVAAHNVGIGTFNPFAGRLIVTGGNVGIGSVTPGKELDIQGTVRASGSFLIGKNILTPTSSVVSIVAGTGLDTVGNSYIKIQGSGGAIDITGGVTQIVAGIDGQELVLYGTSDANTVKFDDGDGLKLDGGVSFTMGNNSCLRLIYNSTGGFWREVSRSVD